MESSTLIVKNLHVQINGKEILKGLDLTVRSGEIHAIMGPNGSGKSTLAHVLLGHPSFSVSKGTILFGKHDLLKLPPNKRAQLGLFLSFQYPFEVQGLGLNKFLFHAYKGRFPQEKINPLELQKKIKEVSEELHFSPAFSKRDLNVGFSGGEKKRSEVLQLRLFKPSLAVLDETDSGLDIDSLKLVSEVVNKMRSPSFSALVITHYKRILDYLKPDFVHVLYDGKLVLSDGLELADALEQKGYTGLLHEKGISIQGLQE
ncbi:Fe-S cluster assembly ATPase SufC [Candidatus Micrarchaeota archaeon]|nr:Fe-S cluster assembly ATPase SufC [Candidatus Micrarchaeota archaeon]MBU1930658.1 Fe-S cluster assembly ATPase SufC [Candidatus Micrarchaeota archaeon]